MGCAPQVRVCPEHALQLNYRKNKEALKAQRKAQKRAEREQKRRQSDENSGEDGEPVSGLGSSKRRKRGTASDLEVPNVAGNASAEPTKHRHHSTAEKGKVPDVGDDAHGRGVHSTSEQQGGSRFQESAQGRKEEKVVRTDGKPSLEEEANKFLSEMFP